MTYDYSKLNGRIVERFGTKRAFAKAMGRSEAAMSAKLTNKVSWRQDDIRKAVEVLGIEDKDICGYFFDVKV